MGCNIAYSKVTTGPDTEPLLLADVKGRLRIDSDEENTDLTFMIQAAREAVEQRTNRSLITQSRTIKFDYFPLNIKLLNGPISSDSADVEITYYDEDNTLQTLSSSEYWVNSETGWVTPVDSWPSTYDRPNAVIVEYVAGYGTASDVPAALRQAIYMVLAHIYENRQAVVMSGSPTAVIEVPLGAEYLMSNFILDESVIY